MGIMGGIAESSHEVFALLFGVVGILSSTLYFLQRFNIFILNFVETIPDDYYLVFFAGFALAAGIILLATTLGLVNISK